MMIKRMTGLFMAVILSGLFIASCDMLANEPKFQTTESGLKYKMIVTNEDQPSPAEGQIITIKMTYGTADTMLFNTNDVPDKNMKLAMRASVYPGDFYEMMGLMHIGDSATFMLDPEAFFVKIAGAHSVPEAVKGATEIVFNVKLENAQTEEEVMKEMEAKMNEMKAGEADIIKKYIADNNIEATPTESGLYVIVTQEGDGPKPVAGDNVKVHYTGTLLDGSKFDSSVDRGEPFEFPIGQGRVIRGWDEGIAMLNVGSKATLIIPSDLGYGERGAGRDIPPFATLVFEVELLGINQ